MLCKSLRLCATVVREGLETVDLTRWVDNNFGRCGFSGAAESGAVGADSPPIVAELAEVIEAWETLPETTKAGILAMVRAAGNRVD